VIAFTMAIALYLFSRWRLDQLDWRRDLLAAGGLAITGLVFVLMLSGPDPLALIAAPLILALGGSTSSGLPSGSQDSCRASAPVPDVQPGRRQTMAQRKSLDQEIEVRILLPQPIPQDVGLMLNDTTYGRRGRLAPKTIEWYRMVLVAQLATW
jgi:hypothetical protein